MCKAVRPGLSDGQPEELDAFCHIRLGRRLALVSILMRQVSLGSWL